MRLPNGDQAIIEPEKVYGYLLSTTHPISRHKAVFFAALGYTADGWERLRDDLAEIARDGDVLPLSGHRGARRWCRSGSFGPARRCLDS